jgi:hypothetical protein
MSNPKSNHSSASPEHEYWPAVSNGKTQIFIGSGNLQGYLCENDSTSDIYLSFYDAADVGDVTLGSTPPVFTQKVKAEDGFGRDSNGYGYRYFGKGCVVAAVSARNGIGAPLSPAILETWSSRK